MFSWHFRGPTLEELITKILIFPMFSWHFRGPTLEEKY